jgi:hypothetical protein
LGEQDAALNIAVAVQNNSGPPAGWIYERCDRAPAPTIDGAVAPPIERPEPEAFRRYRAIEARNAEQDRQRARAAELALNPIFRLPDR